ncbi:sensor histidine kinase [Sorangium sp. So ce128]|uniref:sensor histidine kinase n=1 Tax=Sorangium sp. So ce128 TaxID=3133281 RepID=UPI003F634260
MVAGFMDQAPYQIEAEFDGVAKVTLRLNGGQAIEQAWTGHEPLRCGPVRARFFAFDLETDAIARIGPRMEVRAWLREWSGISVYRDGFRIWPYGEPHDDWLRLDQRRVNNPVVRLSNNQVVGFVEISADRNPELRDQTNREGLIHNDAFADLQRFVLHALQALEAERQAVRHPGGKRPERRPSNASGSQDLTGLSDTLERLARQASGDLGAELKRTADRVRSQIALREATHRRMLDGYSDLAALGHTASMLGRSVNVGIAGLRERVTSLRTALGRRAAADPASLAMSVAELDTMLDLVSGQLSLVASAGSGAARRRRGLDVPVELCRVRDALGPMLDQEDAQLDVHAPEGVLLRTEMRPEIFASLVNVLVRNSLEWRSTGRTLRMSATVRESGDCLEFLFSDNGQGVLAMLEDKLFEPGVSGHDGAGMGLTIARNIVTSHGGAISLVLDRRRKGATFRIQLPRKRSRATTARES